MTKGRLEAFSDGVIAIIITITILEIGLPEGNDMRALIAILHLVACYLISFIMVGTNWANHHHLLQVEMAKYCGQTFSTSSSCPSSL